MVHQKQASFSWWFDASYPQLGRCYCWKTAYVSTSTFSTHEEHPSPSFEWVSRHLSAQQRHFLHPTNIDAVSRGPTSKYFLLRTIGLIIHLLNQQAPLNVLWLLRFFLFCKKKSTGVRFTLNVHMFEDTSKWSVIASKQQNLIRATMLWWWFCKNNCMLWLELNANHGGFASWLTCCVARRPLELCSCSWGFLLIKTTILVHCLAIDVLARTGICSRWTVPYCTLLSARCFDAYPCNQYLFGIVVEKGGIHQCVSSANSAGRGHCHVGVRFPMSFPYVPSLCDVAILMA